jgi:hypothetical protein
MYFIIGTNGAILNNINDVGGENNQNILLEAIQSVLASYFQCKGTAFTESSIKKMKKQFLDCKQKLKKVYALQQKLVRNEDNINEEYLSLSRKQHFYLHSVDQNNIQDFGAPVQYDTGPFETSHKFFTTGIWRTTSKRYKYF